MTTLSRKEQQKKVVADAAGEGFKKGFGEGGRYVLSLLMGLPRPSICLIDPELEPGLVAIVANPRTDLQRERIEKLGELLEALRGTDLRSLMQGEVELSAVQRLEDVIRVCALSEADLERAIFSGEQSPQEWASVFITAVRSAARGEK